MTIRNLYAVHFKTCWRCGIALIFCLSLAIGDSGSGNPTIKVSWAPYFDQQFIILSVTNNNTRPTKIDGGLNFLFGNPTFLRSVKTQVDGESDVISVLALFTAVPGSGSDLPPSNDSTGQGSNPIEIGPNETKVIKYPVDKILTAVVANSNRAQIILSVKGREITKLTLIRTGDVWKEK